MGCRMEPSPNFLSGCSYPRFVWWIDMTWLITVLFSFLIKLIVVAGLGDPEVLLPQAQAAGWYNTSPLFSSPSVSLLCYYSITWTFSLLFSIVCAFFTVFSLWPSQVYSSCFSQLACGYYYIFFHHFGRWLSSLMLPVNLYQSSS